MHLKKYLKKEKMTGKEFAAMLGISKNHLSKVLNGARGMSPTLAKTISELTLGEVKFNKLYRCCRLCGHQISPRKIKKALKEKKEKE